MNTPNRLLDTPHTTKIPLFSEEDLLRPFQDEVSLYEALQRMECLFHEYQKIEGQANYTVVNLFESIQIKDRRLFGISLMRTPLSENERDYSEKLLEHDRYTIFLDNILDLFLLSLEKLNTVSAVEERHVDLAFVLAMLEEYIHALYRAIEQHLKCKFQSTDFYESCRISTSRMLEHGRALNALGNRESYHYKKGIEKYREQETESGFFRNVLHTESFCGAINRFLESRKEIGFQISRSRKEPEDFTGAVFFSRINLYIADACISPLLGLSVYIENILLSLFYPVAIELVTKNEIALLCTPERTMLLLRLWMFHLIKTSHSSKVQRLCKEKEKARTDLASILALRANTFNLKNFKEEQEKILFDQS